MSCDKSAETTNPTGRPPSILSLCNPLLDISAYVEQEILDKYNLKPNNVILAGPEHKNLCQDLVANYQVEYSAGGSAQNVLRVAAGLLRRQKVACKLMFTGCVGDDSFGKMMAQRAQDDGVVTCYAVDKDEPTGTCAVCLTDGGRNRSLCAFLGASQKFTEQHLRSHWQLLVAETDIVYMSGFLIAVSPPSFELLGEHVARSCDPKQQSEARGPPRRFCLNLSAPYVSQVFGAQIDKVIKYVDILFGNDDEARAFAQHKGWPQELSLEQLAGRLCAEPKLRPQVGRLVVITCGAEPVIVASGGSSPEAGAQIQSYACEPIADADMVDTNGAGDAFAGGFLSQYLQGAPVSRCVQVAQYAARQIIKVSGIAVPDFADLPPPEAGPGASQRP